MSSQKCIPHVPRLFMAPLPSVQPLRQKSSLSLNFGVIPTISSISISPASSYV